MQFQVWTFFRSFVHYYDSKWTHFCLINIYLLPVFYWKTIETIYTNKKSRISRQGVTRSLKQSVAVENNDDIKYVTRCSYCDWFYWVYSIKEVSKLLELDPDCSTFKLGDGSLLKHCFISIKLSLKNSPAAIKLHLQTFTKQSSIVWVVYKS